MCAWLLATPSFASSTICDNNLYQMMEDLVSPSPEEWKEEAYKAYVER
jgi:hypothetical protein